MSESISTQVSIESDSPHFIMGIQQKYAENGVVRGLHDSYNAKTLENRPHMYILLDYFRTRPSFRFLLSFN